MRDGDLRRSAADLDKSLQSSQAAQPILGLRLTARRVRPAAGEQSPWIPSSARDRPAQRNIVEGSVIMFRLGLACGLVCLCIGASAVRAEDYDDDAPLPPDIRQNVQRESQRRENTVSPSFLRLQRAIQRSEQRRSRIESRKRMGVSPQRPYFSSRYVTPTADGVQVWPTIPFSRQLPY